LRHETYIDSWLGLLKADNRAIFRASGQARCASAYVLDLEQQRKQTGMDDSGCTDDGA
jgi:antirestriction protein ArdC